MTVISSLFELGNFWFQAAIEASTTALAASFSFAADEITDTTSSLLRTSQTWNQPLKFTMTVSILLPVCFLGLAGREKVMKMAIPRLLPAPETDPLEKVGDWRPQEWQ